MVKFACVEQTYNLNQNTRVISLSQKKNLLVMIPHNSASGHMCADSEAQIWRFTIASLLLLL